MTPEKKLKTQNILLIIGIGLIFGLIYNFLFYPHSLTEFLEAGVISILIGLIEQLRHTVHTPAFHPKPNLAQRRGTPWISAGKRADMSWRTESVVEQKIRSIQLWFRDEYTVKGLCESLEISRTTEYHLINDYYELGEVVFDEGSKGPPNTHLKDAMNK